MWCEPQHLLEVVLYVQVVHAARRDQRPEDRVPLQAGLVREEGEVEEAQNHGAQGSFRDVVVQPKSAVLEELPERRALVLVIGQRRVEWTPGIDRGLLALDPLVEQVEDRAGILGPSRGPLGQGQILVLAVDLEQFSDDREERQGAFRLGQQGLPNVSS